MDSSACGVFLIFFFFFFKQKTAYEISECDWSSDVCSSDVTFRILVCRLLLVRSEEHTSELQSHSEISYAVFCLKKKKKKKNKKQYNNQQKQKQKEKKKKEK